MNFRYSPLMMHLFDRLFSFLNRMMCCFLCLSLTVECFQNFLLRSLIPESWVLDVDDDASRDDFSSLGTQSFPCLERRRKY